LPSGWDIDRSNSAGKGNSKSEEGWGNNFKSWDSLADRFMKCIEHNSEMIRNLSHKIDDLKDLIEKLIKDSPPPPKEYLVIGSLFQAWGSATVSHHYLLLIYFSSRVIS
jgi:hypothetical protein